MNAFQEAAVELNCAILGYKTPAGKPDGAKLKALGGGQNIRFLTSVGQKDCNEGDENDAVLILVPGYGHVEGETLAQATAKMVKVIAGETQTVEAAAAADAAKVPAPARKSKK